MSVSLLFLVALLGSGIWSSCKRQFPGELIGFVRTAAGDEAVEQLHIVFRNLELDPLGHRGAREAYRIVSVGGFAYREESFEILVFADGSGRMEERRSQPSERDLKKRAVWQLSEIEVRMLIFRAQIQSLREMPRTLENPHGHVFDGKSYVFEWLRDGEYGFAFRGSGSEDAHRLEALWEEANNLLR